MLRPAFTLLFLFTLLTGGIYPLTVTWIGQTIFPLQSNGSLIRNGSRVVGSALLGQSFIQPQYFWSRPSATTSAPYDASASAGSNLGPTNPALQTAIKARVKHLRDQHPSNDLVPVDLVTASGSGLDPHISPASALFQVARVAQNRGLDRARVLTLIAEHTEARSLGILGEPRVNVLKLNLALDRLTSKHSTP